MFEVLINLLHGKMGWINLRVLHEEFSRIVRAELDYGLEGRNAERFRMNFSSDDRSSYQGILGILKRQGPHPRIC